MPGRIDFPEFLDADRIGLRIAVSKTKPVFELAGQRTAAAFGEEGVAPVQLHAGLMVVLGLAIPVEAHIAGGDALDAAILVIEDFSRSKARIDFGAELFGLLPQPFHHPAHADDVIAVIMHLRRCRQLEGPGLGQKHEPVVGDRCIERRPLLLPVGDEFVQRAGFQNGAGEGVRPKLGRLLDHADRNLPVLFDRDLTEPDRRRQTSRSSTDNHHVELHALSFHDALYLRLGSTILLTSSRQARSGRGSAI